MTLTVTLTELAIYAVALFVSGGNARSGGCGNDRAGFVVGLAFDPAAFGRQWLLAMSYGP